MSRKEVAWGCNEQFPDAGIKKIMAMHRQSVEAVMHVSISEKPLSVRNTQESFDE